jgi:hypothetical protein
MLATGDDWCAGPRHEDGIGFVECEGVFDAAVVERR